MKIKTTKKEVLKKSDRVFAASYCDLQFLLKYESAVAYTQSAYGWAADIYRFEKCTITTGYKPFGTYIDYDLVRLYDKKAEIIYMSDLSYEDKTYNINNLLKEFLEKII